MASQPTQPTTPSKPVAEEAKNLESHEVNSIDEWSISSPPVVDEWSVPPPTTEIFTPTSVKEGKTHDEVEVEPRRSSKADSWSLSPEKEEEVAHLFNTIVAFSQLITFSFNRLMTGVSPPPQMTGVHHLRAS